MLKRETVSLLCPEAELRLIRGSCSVQDCLRSPYETELMKIDRLLEISGCKVVVRAWGPQV